MEKIISSLIVFILIYLIYLITLILNKKKVKDYNKTNQAQILIKRYKLDSKKIEPKKFANIISLANSFIIALVFFITEFVDNFILKLLVGFLALIPLILVIYHLIGITYQRKEK